MLTDVEKLAAKKATYLGLYAGITPWQERPGPAQEIAILRGVDPDDALIAEVAEWLGFKSQWEYVTFCCSNPEEVRRRLFAAK